MVTILLLMAALGVAPLALGATLLRRASVARAWPSLCSLLLFVLSFNLTFFWQELWLAIPKALTPGLHPVLYHNDHSWTGKAPIVELLQGTGALATLASGGFALALLASLRKAEPNRHLFLFWMAFEGLFQSLSQIAVGTLVPGNDVGRALTYLGAGVAGKALLLATASAAMALTGWALATLRPAAIAGAGPAVRGGLASALIATIALATILITPFRVPREVVEVVLIPTLVNLIGGGWLVLGAALRTSPSPHDESRCDARWPATALLLLLAQLAQNRGGVLDKSIP